MRNKHLLQEIHVQRLERTKLERSLSEKEKRLADLAKEVERCRSVGERLGNDLHQTLQDGRAGQESNILQQNR